MPPTYATAAQLTNEVNARTAGDANLQSQINALTARVAALEAPVPTPTPPGWVQVFDDTFGRTVAQGQFIAGGSVVNWTAPSGTVKTAGTKTADGKYIAFGTSPTSNWGDTTKHGTYAESAVISIGSNKLTEHIYSDSTGYGHTCVITPLPTGGSTRGGLVGARSLVTARADALPGFKGVFLFWADVAEANVDLEKLGEIDGPESPFNALPKTYLHRTGATTLNDTVSFSYPNGTSWNDWHDYVTEWIPGISVEWFIDNVSIGRTTDRVPTVAMHFNIQPETNTGTGPWPAANTSGLLEISHVSLWKQG